MVTKAGSLSVFPTVIFNVSPVIIGIDVSTKTGLCLAQGGKHEEPKIIRAETVTAPGLEGIARAKEIASVIDRAVVEYRPTLAIIEGYGFNNKFTLATMVEIGTLIRYTTLKHKVPTCTLTPKSLKEWVTGNGAAKKPEMLSSVLTRWGYKTKDDNQADAIGLAMAGLASIGAIDCTKDEKKIIATLSFLSCLPENTQV